MIHMIRGFEVRNGRRMPRGWCGTWHIVKHQGGAECAQCRRVKARELGVK